MARPRKSNVKRDTTTGRSRGEDVRSVVIAYRARDVGEGNAADPMAGYTIGRMHLRREITREQLDAGNWYAALIRGHASILGYQIDKLNSPGFEMVSYGVPCSADPSEEVTSRIKADFRDSYRLLVDQGIGVAVATYDACLERLAGRDLQPHEVKLIGIGLHSLSAMRK